MSEPFKRPKEKKTKANKRAENRPNVGRKGEKNLLQRMESGLTKGEKTM